MKILFLDIDGVLNSEDNEDALLALWKLDKTPSRDEFGKLFDERCVRWLRWIVEKTSCKIVISSSWRDAGLNEMQLMWELRDLPGEVIDCTPFGPCDEIEYLYQGIGFSSDRGLEIEQWIQKHNPNKYCIVDDNNDMLPHQQFVQTDGHVGLNRKTAMAIMAILNSI